MDMAADNTHLYEALTGAGIQPDGARKVERAIENVIDERQNKALGTVMMREDGLRLEQRLGEKIDQKTRKLEQKIEKLEQKIDRNLYWVVGTIIGLVIAVKTPWHF